MRIYLFVFLFGGLGCVCRLLVSRVAAGFLPPDFPYGTFIVNLLGSFLIGVAAGYSQRFGGAGGWAYWPGAVTGFLGGFTTFSSFSLENYTLWQEGRSGIAVVYTVMSLALSLGAVAAGYAAGRYLSQAGSSV